MYKIPKIKTKFNKKAQTGSVMEDFFAAIAIIFLIFAFYVFSTIIFNIEKKDIEVKAKNQAFLLEQNQLTKEISMLKYSIEGQEISFIDLVRLSKIDLKYQTILEEKISEIKETYPDFKIEDIT